MSGRIDSRITMNENDISGVLSMPQANIMDIPLNFRLPFKWDMKNNFMLDNANLNTKAASVKLSSLVDIENLKVSAKGEAQNISITEIGRMFAPEANLKGDKGFLKFDLNTILTGDILNNTDGEFFIKMPSFSAAGFKILDNLDSHAKLKPNHAPELSLSGKIFGGKLFARGEADQDSEGNFKPKAIISVVNLDLNTLVASIPELKNSIEKPSGKISIKSTVHENFDVDINLNSDKLGAFGYNLTKLNGAIKYLFADQKINIEKFSSYFGKGAINANGNVNLNDQNFKFNADVKNFEPNIIPELKDVKGIYNLTAVADGKFSDVKTIKANANLTAQNVGYSDITLGNLKIPVNYSNNIINIPGAETQLPGGRLNFIAKIDINNASNPDLNILAATKGINLSEVLNKFNLQNNEMPITGSINGEIKLNGRLNSAIVKTDLTGEKIRVGKLVYIPGAILNAEGNMEHIKLNRLDAAVNFSNLHVDGDFYPDLNDFMASTFDINSSLRNFNLEPNLRRFTGTSSPVKGKLDLNAKLSGNGYTPVLILKVPGPLDVSGVSLEDIFINLRSPKKNNYAIISSVKTGKFVLGASTNLKLHGQNMDEVAFNVTTQPMKLANLVETFAPDAAGMAGGEAVLKVSGNYPLNIPIDVNLTADEIIAAEKIKILNLNVPVKYLPDKNSVSMKNANAIISDGTIRSNLNVDLNSTKWTGDLRVRGLDFGKIVTSFLPEGELIGSADLDLTAKGKYSGVWPNSYANGKFRTSPGYLHKMKMLDSVTPTKRVSYEYIKGTFYWDGKDLNFSPGTQAQAGPGEPLYRYVSVSGACGVLGEGLKLYFDGRFDLKILDRLKWIHSKDIVYRDIKPENFLFGINDPNVIYIIDFGLCRKYRSSKTRKHILPKYTGEINGTLRFVSPNVIKGKTISRRDDLVSLGYVLIFLLKKKLPWDLKFNNFTKEIYLELLYLKQTNGYGRLFKDLPQELIDYIKYTRNLKFEQDPDYSYLRSLFLKVLFKISFNYKTLTFSWIKPENQKLIGIPENRSLRKSSTQNRIYKNILENSTRKNRTGRSQDILDNRDKFSISIKNNFPFSSVESIPNNIYIIKDNCNNNNDKIKNFSSNNFQKGLQINFQINSNNSKEKKINKQNLKDINLEDISSSFKLKQNYFSNKNILNSNSSLKDNDYNRTSEEIIITSPTPNYNLKSIIKLKKNKTRYHTKKNSINIPTNIGTQINNIIFSSQIKINNSYNINNSNNNNNNKKYKIIKKRFKTKKLNHCLTNNFDFGKNCKNVEANLNKDICYQSPISKKNIHDLKKNFSLNQFSDTNSINKQKDKLLTNIRKGGNSNFNDNLYIKNNKNNILYNKSLNSKYCFPLYNDSKSEKNYKINKENKKNLNKNRDKINHLFRRNETYLYHSKLNNINNSLKKLMKVNIP